MIGRSRNRAAGACVAILVTLALAGCSGGGSGGDSTPATSTSTVSTPSSGGSGMVVPIQVLLATSDANSSHGAQLAIGDTLEIRLESQPDSGFVWSVTHMPDKSILKGSGKDEPVLESPAPGVSAEQVFTFKAVDKGWAVIEIAYAKPSGGKSKRMATFRIQVF